MNMTRIIVASALAAGSVIAVQAQEPGQARGVKAPNLPFASYFLRGPLESQVVKGMPYSAEVLTESIQALSDGNRIVHRTTGRVYRDGQGRVRREDDQASGAPTISITDPVANTSLTIDVANKTARETRGMQMLARFMYGLTTGTGDSSTYQSFFKRAELPQGTGAGGGRGTGVGAARGSGTGVGGRGRAQGAGYEQDEEQLSNRTIEGVTASGVRRTTTIPKDTIGNEQPIRIVSEEWTSPELRVLVLTDFNDPRTGRSTYKLLKIKRAEPDAALFKAPEGYTVQRAVGRGGRGRGGN